jgi:hypothetical protein
MNRPRLPRTPGCTGAKTKARKEIHPRVYLEDMKKTANQEEMRQNGERDNASREQRGEFGHACLPSGCPGWY